MIDDFGTVYYSTTEIAEMVNRTRELVCYYAKQLKVKATNLRGKGRMLFFTSEQVNFMFPRLELTQAPEIIEVIRNVYITENYYIYESKMNYENKN